MVVKSHSCILCCFQRHRLVSQLNSLDIGNVDIVAVEESQLFSDFAADSIASVIES